MFIGIDGAMRDYAWGSTTAIAELLGRPASGGPEAELWFGAHPAAPSTVSAATPERAGQTLDTVIAGDPLVALGAGHERLPFLLKVLAAGSPLSLQVHPDLPQAVEGFRRENEAGIALDDPARNYRDDNHKPELVYALSPTFEALAGFRNVAESRLMIAELALSAPAEQRGAVQSFGQRLAGDGDDATVLADIVRWLLGGGEDVDAVVAAVVASADRAAATSSFAREWSTAVELDQAYPGDPGIVISLLLNHVSLRQGQALALQAGVIHAYLSGVGIEVMAASDNVLRGGLTPKHVDVAELLRVATFAPSPSPVVQPDEPQEGVQRFRPTADDFELLQIGVGDAAAIDGYRLTGPEQVVLTLTGPAVVLNVDGGAVLDGSTSSITLARGDAAFVGADERTVTIRGSAVLFVATTP